jgi:hypothetical protein
MRHEPDLRSVLKRGGFDARLRVVERKKYAAPKRQAPVLRARFDLRFGCRRKVPKPVTASIKIRGGFAFFAAHFWRGKASQKPSTLSCFVLFRDYFLCCAAYFQFFSPLCKTCVFYHTDDNGWCYALIRMHGRASVHGGSFAAALASLDVGTLFFIAICVTILLGLFASRRLQEGNRALAGGASLI